MGKSHNTRIGSSKGHLDLIMQHGKEHEKMLFENQSLPQLKISQIEADEMERRALTQSSKVPPAFGPIHQKNICGAGEGFQPG